MEPEQPISELWFSTSIADWQRALERYWRFIQPSNLRDVYFRWKYTAANRYATSCARLLKLDNPAGRERLNELRKQIVAINPAHIRRPIDLVSQIPGLGTAGASGLLALLFPRSFGTVDQFVVKALRDVPGLLEAGPIAKMNPNSLTTADAIVLIGVMRRQATKLTDDLGSAWRPRDVDKVLWTYGRD